MSNVLSNATPEWRKCFELLADDSVSEIEVNGHDLFFMKQNGKRLPINVKTRDDDEYYDGIEKSLLPVVKKFNTWGREDFIFEGPLEFYVDGKRIKARTHIVLPPASYSPQITIAKKSTSLTTLDSISNRGSMSLEMKHFLEMCIRGKLCVVLSGSTGAGKTTMLEALAKLIPSDTRIGVAEDTPELELIQKNVSYLHSVPFNPGMDPNRVASLQWCVAQFNRMRTDMLIIGETRGKEFASFLTAANSGMEGCLTTIHSTSAKGCLDKMTNFALAGNPGLPIRSIRSDVSKNIDIVVQLVILSNGKHRVESITQVTNTLSDKENAEITTNLLYKYDYTNDVFIKENNIDDTLRKVLTSRGVNFSEFLKTRTGTVLMPMGGTEYSNSVREAWGSEEPRKKKGLPIPPPVQNRSI